jgi:hypothetical protein
MRVSDKEMAPQELPLPGTRPTERKPLWTLKILAHPRTHPATRSQRSQTSFLRPTIRASSAWRMISVMLTSALRSAVGSSTACSVCASVSIARLISWAGVWQINLPGPSPCPAPMPHARPCEAALYSDNILRDRAIPAGCPDERLGPGRSGSVRNH